MMWCLNDARLKVLQETMSHTVTPPPLSSAIDTTWDGSVLSRCLHPTRTPVSKCYSRNEDSSNQATYFQSSVVQFW